MGLGGAQSSEQALGPGFPRAGRLSLHSCHGHRVSPLCYVWVGGGSRQAQPGLTWHGRPSWRTTGLTLDAQSLGLARTAGQRPPGGSLLETCCFPWTVTLAGLQTPLSWGPCPAPSQAFRPSWPGPALSCSPSSPAVWPRSLFLSLVLRQQETMAESTEPCLWEEGIVWM